MNWRRKPTPVKPTPVTSPLQWCAKEVGKKWFKSVCVYVWHFGSPGGKPTSIFCCFRKVQFSQSVENSGTLNARTTVVLLLLIVPVCVLCVGVGVWCILVPVPCYSWCALLHFTVESGHDNEPRVCERQTESKREKRCVCVIFTHESSLYNMHDRD